MIKIKKLLILALIITTIFNGTSIISAREIKSNDSIVENTNYSRGSKRGTLYSGNVPIDISVSYMYEENNGSDNYSFGRVRIISINSCSATCRSLDYSGTLTATSSYTDFSILVSVYGTLTNKKNPEKTITVSETFTFNI